MNSSPHAPKLTLCLYVIGILEIIGGFVLCIKLWPKAAEQGYQWLFVAYTPALTWLFAGIICGLLFFTAGSVLMYLENIRYRLTDLNDKILYKPEGEG